jgi:hypothetical protein
VAVESVAVSRLLADELIWRWVFSRGVAN